MCGIRRVMAQAFVCLFDFCFVFVFVFCVAINAAFSYPIMEGNFPQLEIQMVSIILLTYVMFLLCRLILRLPLKQQEMLSN